MALPSKRKRPKIVSRTVTCQHCWGAKYVSVYDPDGEGGGAICPTCKGSGFVTTNLQACRSCGHETVYISPKMKKFLAKLAQKKPIYDGGH